MKEAAVFLKVSCFLTFASYQHCEDPGSGRAILQEMDGQLLNKALCNLAELVES